jgi:hypothetical protein
MPEGRIRVVAVNDGKPYVSPPPDADGNYKYYLLGNVRPVRLTYNAKKLPIASEAPDPSDGGALKIDNELIGRIMSSPEVEDISRDEFVELCRRAASRSSP